MMRAFSDARGSLRPPCRGDWPADFRDRGGAAVALPRLIVVAGERGPAVGGVGGQRAAIGRPTHTSIALPSSRPRTAFVASASFSEGPTPGWVPAGLAVGPGGEDQLSGLGGVPVAEPKTPQSVDDDRGAARPAQLA